MSTLRPRLELNFKTIFWLPARWWYGMLRHWNMYTSALWHGGKVETLLFTCEPATLEPVGRVENYACAYCSSSSSKLGNGKKRPVHEVVPVCSGVYPKFLVYISVLAQQPGPVSLVTLKELKVFKKCQLR